MKKDLHPKLNHVVFIDTACKAEFATLSTLKSEETKKINGVEHYVIHVDVSSASHPFYTGEKMLVDTAGRVDKFRARMETAKKLQEEAEKRNKKKDADQKESVEEKISKKAKANTEAKAAEKAEKDAKKKEEAKKAAEKLTKKESDSAEAPSDEEEMKEAA